VACGDHGPATAPVLALPSGPSASLAIAGFASTSVNAQGSAAVRNGALELTNAAGQVGSAWAPAKQRFSKSWETSFDFRVDKVCQYIGDGFTFVIQNMSGTQAPSGGGGQLGYQNYTNAVVVEFDEYFSGPQAGDPNDNHIAVVTNAVNAVSATTVMPLATATPPFLIRDGNTHTARIHYDPGTLQIFVDGGATALLTVPLDLTNIKGGNILDANGGAWVGFTSATGSACASHKILNWTLSDNRPPVTTLGSGQGFSGNEASPITLSASATDPDGDAILRYEWDLNNDGTTDTVTATGQLAHTWSKYGDYTVGVASVDAYGARSAVATAAVHVANLAPVVTAPDSLQAKPGTAMGYSASFSDAGSQDGPWQYVIDWGDNTADTATAAAAGTITATHTYAATRVDPYVVNLTVTDNAGAAGSAKTSVSAGKLPASVTLGSLSATYDGTAHAVTATTNPAGLSYAVTYDGASSAPVNAGTYAVVATVTDPHYDGTASGSLVIAQPSQSITFDSIPDHTYGDPPFTLNAVGGGSTSPLAYSLDPTSRGCTLSGATVTIVSATGNGPGCTIIAQQAGDRNYTAAASVTRSFSIARAKPKIKWSPSNLTYGAPIGPSQLDATALDVNGQPLGGSFNYDPTAGTLPSAGTQTLQAAFTPADPNYDNAAATATVTVIYTTSAGHQFQAPMGRNNMFKAGSVIPLKFLLYLAGGVTPVTTAQAHLEVYSLDVGGRAGSKVALPGPVNFAWNGGHYQLDFDTSPLTAGNYRLIAVLDDGSTIAADITVR